MSQRNLQTIFLYIIFDILSLKDFDFFAIIIFNFFDITLQDYKIQKGTIIKNPVKIPLSVLIYEEIINVYNKMFSDNTRDCENNKLWKEGGTAKIEYINELLVKLFKVGA
jgi:hypothetical protein